MAFLPCHCGWLFLFPAMPTKWNWNNFRYNYVIIEIVHVMCMYYYHTGTATRFCTLKGMWEAVNTDNCAREEISILNNTVRLLQFNTYCHER